jgi:hypothetical protein
MVVMLACFTGTGVPTVETDGKPFVLLAGGSVASAQRIAMVSTGKMPSTLARAGDAQI